MQETKICSKCGIEKSLSEFNKCSKTKSGVQPSCKDCRKKFRAQNLEKSKEYRHNYYQKNKESILKKTNKYRNDNKDKMNAANKKWRIENKSRIRENYKNWRDNNKQRLNEENRIKYKTDKRVKEYKKKYIKENVEYFKEYNAKYYEENKSIIKLKQKEYNQQHRPERRKYINTLISTDVNYKLSITIRSRINLAIKRQAGTKARKSMELLGCTIQECREYLESQFQEGMTWENHGLYGWHIDHILPCASFDLTDPEQQKQCFHYTNLQPLWAEDNLSKSAKY